MSKDSVGRSSVYSGALGFKGTHDMFGGAVLMDYIANSDAVDSDVVDLE